MSSSTPEDREFLPQQWTDRGKKHRLKPGVPIPKLKQQSAEKDGISRYYDHVSEQQQRQMEESCASDEANRIPSKHRNIRYYWQDVGRTIGFAGGHDTSCFLCVWDQSGTLHGYPVTMQEIDDLKRRAP